MLEVSKYIRELLFIHDCVILPGFGGFVANYNPARIDENQNVAFPPSKVIGFNRNLTQNDGLLINHLSESENLTYSEAEKSVLFFVEDIGVKIQRGEKVTLENIGCFFNDKRRNLQFEPANNLNYLSDSFGLEQLELPGVSKFEGEMKRLVSPGSSSLRTSAIRRRLWYAAAAAPFVLAATLFTGNPDRYYEFLDSASLSLLEIKSDIERNLSGESRVFSKPQISPPWEFVDFNPETLLEPQEETFQRNEARYYLIAGSFASLRNAETFRDELIMESYPALVVEGKELFLVAMDQFETLEEADR